MKIQIISLFPEMFKPVLGSSILKRAQEKGVVHYELIDLRDFGLGLRKQVDDTTYGGGDGMLLKVEPIVKAIDHAKQSNPKARVILPSPRGNKYVQSNAKQLALNDGLILVCPRYEGYDERVTNWVDEVYSIGNYVLTGGELPAMIIIDSVVRLIPGVLGNDNSKNIESYQLNDTNIEFPQYTRPDTFNGLRVPEVLLSGNHAEIEKWRKANSNKN